MQTQRTGLDTNVETHYDDGRDRGNDGTVDGASFRLDVCRFQGIATGVKLRCEMQVAEYTTSGCKRKHEVEAEIVSPTCQEKDRLDGDGVEKRVETRSRSGRLNKRKIDEGEDTY